MGGVGSPVGPGKRTYMIWTRVFREQLQQHSINSVPIKSLENNVNLINTKYFLPHQQNVHVQTLCNHSQFGYTFIY